MYYPIVSYNMFQPGYAVCFAYFDAPVGQGKQAQETTLASQEVPVFNPKESSGCPALLASSAKPVEPVCPVPVRSSSKDDNILPPQYLDNESSDFNPKRDRDIRKKKKPKAKENENRNVIPNLVHQIFSFSFKRKKSCRIVNEAFDAIKGPAEASVPRFYLYQARVKESMNHYVNTSSLSIFSKYADPDFSVYSEAEQDYYLTISRTVARHFLRWLSPLVTLTSRRMSANKKFEHLRTRRILMQRLAGKEI